MTTFRFLHCADIHLDSPLKGLSGRAGGAAERIRGATREAFELLVDRAVAEQLDFLVIAGDLYDGDWRDYHTGLFFVRQMGRLNEAGIPVYLLYGNHDAVSRITRHLILPDNVQVFASRAPQSFTLPDHRVVLHGQSFHQRDVVDNLALAYPDPVPDAFNIGVLHTGLGGLGGHENYAPCTLADLVNKGYDYWALGHVHQRQLLNERPHVLFPGNLQGRHVREAGEKGATLVEVTDGEVTALTPVPCDVVRWAVLPVDASGIADVGEMVERIHGVLETAVAELADGRLLACRLVLTGTVTAHESLLAGADELLEQARSAALGLGDEVAWVEKLVIDTAPPEKPRVTREREDAIGELRRMLGEAGDDAALRRQLEADIGLLARSLPHDARQEADTPALRAALDNDCDALIQAAAPYLYARLTAAGD